MLGASVCGAVAHICRCFQVMTWSQPLSLCAIVWGESLTWILSPQGDSANPRAHIFFFCSDTNYKQNGHLKFPKVYGMSCAIAQAVIRRFPTAAPRVRTQIRLCGICGGQSCTMAGFLRVLRFLLTTLIQSTAPHSSSIIRGWYSKPISGRRKKWTVSPQYKEVKKKKVWYEQTVSH
jgi:hypothetical protein